MADPQLVPNMAGYQSFVHQLDPRIRPLRCTKEHLEGRKYGIMSFTAQFFKTNEHVGQLITRIVVEFFWIDEIWRLYPTDNPEKNRLIGQAHSPKYEVYWQKRLDAEAFKAKRARQSSAEIWSFPRQLSRDEQKEKGTVILGNHDWEYILPDVQLMPLYHVFFLDLAKKIIAANPGKPLSIELMRRLWRLLIREVYDFVNEAERTAKLEEAKAVTDDEFEEATRAVPEKLSKKRGISPESDSEDEISKSRRKSSKKTKTVSFAGIEGSSGQMGADQTEPKPSIRPKLPVATTGHQPANNAESSTISRPSAAVNGHQPVNNSESSVQGLIILEQNRRIGELAAKLDTAERQVAEHKGAKDSADHRWRSQQGQLLAAERAARELRRVNPNVAHYMKMNNDAEHKLKSQYGELKRTKEKVAELERDLRAEKGRTARMEASMAKAEVGARCEKITEAGEELSRK